jgi:hypothetical protein
VPRPDLHEGIMDLRNLFSGRYRAARNLSAIDIADPSLIDCLTQSGFIADSAALA